MKKQLKGIIGLGAVLAVLGGGLGYLKYTDNTDDTSSEEEVVVSPDEAARGAGIILVENSNNLPVPADQAPKEGEHMHYAEGTVKSIHVKNRDAEYDVKMFAKPEGNIGARYTLEGFEDLPVDTGIVATLVNNINGVASASVIQENCTDFAKYGLEDPDITAEMTYESGVVKKYYVGIKNPASPTESYFRLEGSDTVYTISNSKVANYYKTPKEFLKKTILEKPADDKMPVVKELDIERKDIDYNFVIKYGENSDDKGSGGTSANHVLVEPVSAYLTVEKSSDITNGMFGLSGDDIYAYHCTDDDIKKAGLNDPFCKVTMQCGDGNTYKLLLSEVFTENEKDRKCYAMLEGSNMIYILAESNAKWLNVKPIDIASRLMIANYVWNISELSIKTSDGKSEEFKIVPKNKSKELYGSTAEDFDVTKNGKPYNAERYRQFYSFLLKANAEDFALDAEKPEGEPVAVIEFKDIHLGEDYKFEIYNNSAMTTLIMVDGKPKFLGSRSYADTLLKNIGLLDGDDEFITTWK